MENLWVSAGIRLTKHADLAETKQALLALRDETLKEPGCLQFDILQQRDHPENFTLWEHWKREEDLQNHFREPHTTAYLARDLTEVVYIEKLNNPSRIEG